jgi:hypothetical protein
MRFRIILAGLVALVGASQAVASVSASSVVEDFGSRAKLFYLERKTPDPYTAGLNRIRVTPPLVFGEFSGQQVGWRAVVHESGPQQRVFRSALQTAFTTAGMAPAFTPVDLHISEPALGDAEYRITIRMIWYAADGTRERVTNHDMQSGYYYDNHRFWHHLWDERFPYELQTTWVDGP